MAKRIVFTVDRFSSININAANQDLDFESNLIDAITTWRDQNHKGVWITVPKEKSSCIPKLIELGFDFHHAQPGYVMLVKWLPKDLPNNLPAYANHYVGVGGFVVNDKKQILVIREKYNIDSRPSQWKLPGGLADKGEELGQTAQREVFEETGVQTEFLYLLAFRHMHGYRHGCSDIYFVCVMKPLTQEIDSCPNEIAECKWMELDDYENYLTENNISHVNQYFVKQYKNISETGYSLAPHNVLSYDKKSINVVYGIDSPTDGLHS